MSIRARLTIGVLVLLIAVFAVMGVAMARSTESTLIEQCDQDVVKQLERMYEGNGDKKYGGPGGDDDTWPGFGPYGQQGASVATPAASPAASGKSDDYDQERAYATFIYSADGAVEDSKYSGYPDDQDSPPALPDFGSSDWNGLIGHIKTLRSEDGSLEYRVLVKEDTRNGDFIVVAAPLDDVVRSITDLITRFIVIGLISLAIAALAIWWVIRNQFKPVDSMIDTAAAIASGDLSRRVPEAGTQTELGRLGNALNEMLGQIEQGLKQRDVTEARLRRFVADAAHELRTPLTSVRGYSELYRQGAYQNQESVDHAMARIESEGSRMARLVDDLLLLARLDQQRPIEQRPTDLVSLANEAATDFETVSPDYPLDLSGSGEIVVRGDRIRIRQIIDNLLNNARTHTPKGTPIHLAVRRSGDTAEITVADEGPGIRPEDRERVFERFWRADTSRTRNTGGSGLGLSIVQSLVQAHGGSVAVDSEPGRGARFTVRLPILTSPAPSGD